jgi:hypothetical protein
MPLFSGVSLHLSNYRCFGEELYGFDKILPVNLIIGRNNSGKSSLLDLVEVSLNGGTLQAGNRDEQPRLVVTEPLTEQELGGVFPQGTRGGDIPNQQEHYSWASRWLGSPLRWERAANGEKRFVSVSPPLGIQREPTYGQRLVAAQTSVLSGHRFRRIAAERDIRPEQHSGFGTPSISPNGAGATDAITQFLTRAVLPSGLITTILLNALNTIFAPDVTFTEILTRQHDQGMWEIYLLEGGKGRVPLSRTGSGIKTVLLILAHIYLTPEIEHLALSHYVFGIEEPENNLHPALQRRLFAFLRKTALQHGCTFFVTTHSNVIIDIFANDDVAQIIHVTHDEATRTSQARRVQTYIEHTGILDDLDVRASDLLQANCIVWLEGPTDRLYFNRWLDVAFNGRLREGSHYQCIFYGGRLLAHLTGAAPDVTPDDVVQILRVNRNAIVVIDSDRDGAGDDINASKQRIEQEIVAIGGISWVTSGREIENYIPTPAVRAYFRNETLPDIEPFERFAAYLDTNVSEAEGMRFRRNKVLYAEHFIPHIDLSGMRETLDLYGRAREAGNCIARWNRIEEIAQ